MLAQIDFSTPLTDAELEDFLAVGDYISSLPAPIPFEGEGFVESEQMSEEEYWGVWDS